MNRLQRTNGQVCIIQNHSADNAELYKLTWENHWRYAVRHGYDLHVFVEPFETAKWGLLNAMQGLLRQYDHLFHIGSDVVITRPEMPLSAFYADEYGAVVSTEQMDPAVGLQINNDTLLLNNNAKGHEYLDYLRSYADTWTNPLLQQSLTTQLIRERQDIVAVKRIQGTPCNGQWGYWRPAEDFCIHFMVNGLQHKINYVRRFLEHGLITW